MARRSYGSGSLVVRADANGAETWYGLWRTGQRRVKRALGPKRSPGSRDGLTRSQAEAELRRRMQEQFVVIGRAERKTVAEAGERDVEHLATVKRRKRTTIEDYRGYLRRHLVPHFGERTLDRIEPAQIEAYLHAKLATLSAKTVTNHLTFLHGLFGFAVRRRWAETNPVALVDRPPATRQHASRIRFLQPVEVEAVLHAVPPDELGATDAALYLCAVTTGLRQGELLALKWLDVDWLAQRIRVADNFPRGHTAEPDTPKSHSLRSVPMADRLAGELERHFQRSRYRSDDDLVFCHPHNGDPNDASTLRSRFYEWTSEEVVRRWLHAEHDWETTEATVDLRVGGDVRVVMGNPHEDIEYGGGGRYTEVEPPTRLAFTWIWDGDDTRQLIELDFEETDGATTVRFTHSGLWDEEAVRSHEGGWGKAFDNLERTLAGLARSPSFTGRRAAPRRR